MKPAFLIVGAQRCGTTTLYHGLDAHARIHMAKPPWPEPKYFLAEPVPGRGLDWYLESWFSDCGDAEIAGEKSTSYFEVSGVPARIRAALPDVKIVVQLRHPVERAVSNYRFSRRHGLETETLDAAVRAEPDRLRTSYPGVSAHPFAYLRRGRYVEHLRHFLDVFQPDAIRVGLLEDLLADPEAELAGLCRFLGVAPQPGVGAALPHSNAEPRSAERCDRATLEFMLDEFREPNRELGVLLGRDLSAWNELTPELLALTR